MMWNNLLDNAKKVADKAKAAAENLEGQLNESVGATPEILASNSYERKRQSQAPGTSLFNSLGRGLMDTMNEATLSGDNENDDDDEDDVFNDDAFYDDDFDENMYDDEQSVPTADDVNQTDEVEDTDGMKKLEDESSTSQESVTEGVKSTSSDHDEDEIIKCQSTPDKDNQTYGEEYTEEREEGENHLEELENKDKIVNAEEEQPITSEENRQQVELDANDDNEDIQNIPELNPDNVEQIEGDRNEIENIEIETNHIDTTYDTKNIIVKNEVDKGTNALQQVEYDATTFNNMSDDSALIKNDESLQGVSDERMEIHPPCDADSNEVTLELTPELDHSNASNSPDNIDDDDDLSVYVSKEEINPAMTEDPQFIQNLQSEIIALKQIVEQREGQLTAKAEQMFTMNETHEQEKTILESKIRVTKEEAKKRIVKAKEKVDSTKAKLDEALARANNAGSNSSEQDEIINALRKEGENLAMKQSKMQELVREARSELRDVQEELESQTEAKESAHVKINELTQDLEETKRELFVAREGEGRADKLDSDLLTEREEREKNASKILNLEATIKEMKLRHSESLKETQSKMSDAIVKIESEKSSIGIENDAIIKDLEFKLRASEREANVREDSLRHEVDELRKRWQDSVRRSDSLSMDLQQSSAPLMRQLESAERQSRTRAAAWAELESKLRNDLEENMIQNEELNKKKYEIELELKQQNRLIKLKEAELSTAEAKMKELNDSLDSRNADYNDAAVELESIKSEYSSFRTQSKEKESKIRSDLMMRLRENEERNNDHIESLQVDLRQEREKRLSLEEKIKEINMSSLVPKATNYVNETPKKAKKRTLGGKVNQVDILQDTLLGLNGIDNDSESDDETLVENVGGPQESFAFIEQLSQALKAANSERESLRGQLLESEEKRRLLENECVLNKGASTKLPTLEAEIIQIRRLNQEKDMEIEGLSQDIFEVRQMYRTQLDVLLEEKATGEALDNSNIVKQKVVPNNESKTKVPKFGMMPSF